MFQVKVAEKIKLRIFCSKIFIRKSCLLWNNVQKFGTGRRGIHNNIMLGMNFECWVTKVRNTHSEFAILSFKYSQHDTNLNNILFCYQCSTCFRRFLRPSSGAQNCTHSIWYMSSVLAATASGSSKQEYCITLHLVGYTWRTTAQI
jgi:hypothetical protein